MESADAKPQNDALERQKQNAKRRIKSARLAARALTLWLQPELASHPNEINRQSERWLARLGEENTRKLTMRLRRMADWELVRAEQMRDAKASPWMLLKFVGAQQDMVIDGPDCRDTIYTEVLQAGVERKRMRSREAFTKVAVPLAVVATVATLATAGIGYVAALAAPGLTPAADIASAGWENWKTMFKPVLTKAANLVDFDAATGGVMFVLGAFWMWAHDSRITEDLRKRAGEHEVPNLEQAIGFLAKGPRIQTAIRAIPPHQRILLSHLRSTDLRAFLLSTDAERIVMLRENRPPLIAHFKSILASRPRTIGSILPTIRDLADVCLPKKWARAMHLPHPGEIDAVMASHWRAPDNHLANIPGQELDGARRRRKAASLPTPQPSEPVRSRFGHLPPPSLITGYRK